MPVGDRRTIGAVPVVLLVVEAGDVELAADALWQAGPSAVGEEALPDGRVQLTADVADVAAVPRPWLVTVLDEDGEAHLEAWRQWAQPVRVGERVVLHPAWLPVGPVEGDDVIVRLDPGRTFGSGSHPSTRLAVAALLTYGRLGDRVLDVGGGSGVLAVVAARLGAASALAIDVDPASPAVTRANARANGVDHRVMASNAPLGEVEGAFDIVLANIGVRVLGELARDLVRRVRPGGLLVLAGLLDAQVDPLLETAYSDVVEVERSTEEGWTAIVLRA